MLMRVGIVGCGQHAATHADAVAAHPGAVLTACLDADPGRAARFAAEYAAAPYSNLAEMARSRSVDLLVVAAFPSAHAGLVREAMGCGFSLILCEKPLSLTLEDALDIERQAARTGSVVLEGLMYRSHPQMIKALELVAEGAIGEVQYVHAQFTDYGSDHPGNWRNQRSLGGGSMTAKGCYLVDACNLFAGSRASGAFAVETVDPRRQVEIGMSGTIRYENGVVGHFETNHRSVWREEIRVVGTTGTLTVPHAIVTKRQPRRVVLERNGHYEFRPNEREEFDFAPCNSYELQLSNIRDVFLHGGQPNYSLQSAIVNYRVTDAIARSAQSGKMEPVRWA